MVDYNSLNDTHKKAAARRATVSCSTDPVSAVHEYIRRTGIELPPAEAEKEMLSFLEGYRHPVDGKDRERMIFHAVFPTSEINGCFAAFEGGQPLSKAEVEKGVPDPLRSRIIGYMIDCEITNRELRLVRSELEQAKNELDALSELVNRAREEYRPVRKGEDASKRARRVAAVFDLTNGKRKKEYTDHELYALYVNLVRKNGDSREDAIASVADSFDLAKNTVLQHLNSSIAKVKKKWRNEAPQAWPAHEKYLKELVPFKGDWSL